MNIERKSYDSNSDLIYVSNENLNDSKFRKQFNIHNGTGNFYVNISNQSFLIYPNDHLLVSHDNKVLDLFSQE